MLYNPDTKTYQYETLNQNKLRHCITTRYTFNNNNFNLSQKIFNEEIKLRYKSQLSKTFFSDLPIVFPKQVSGDNIWIVENHFDTRIEADAIITNNPNIALGILTADCVPIILHDQKENVLGLVHAGWRGTAANLTSKTIELMNKNFNTQPHNIHATIGPSISMKNYEIGSEVAQIFKHKYPTALLSKEENGKFLLNLWDINQRQLTDAGVQATRIEIANICTFDTEEFYSARRDGIETGRFGTIATLKK